ncbi:MAG TPA: TspO/MBR family protein [Polyangiales bacterium]|nr:TspO/MBR family protein [Polyangiales bacterium]
MQHQLARQAAGLALFGGAAFAAAATGAWASPARSTATRLWFWRLRKPPFQPPARVFGPVWSALYPAVALSGYRAWRAEPSIDRRRALRWWGVQMGLNGLWSPLFFGAKEPRASLVDSALLFASTGNYARHARKIDKPAAWLALPYLAWLGFATVLNAEIVRRNR